MAAAAWHTSSLELLRNLINDVNDTNYLYQDTRLIKLLVVAGFQVLREADFSQDFVVDIAAQDITPDPTDTTTGTNDEDFINLMCLKAACILSHGAAILASEKAVAGKDMNSSWDLKGVAENTITLLKEGWCKVYDAALDDYIYGDGTIGAAVTGPFRTRSRGSFGWYEY